MSNAVAASTCANIDLVETVPVGAEWHYCFAARGLAETLEEIYAIGSNDEETDLRVEDLAYVCQYVLPMAIVRTSGEDRAACIRHVAVARAILRRIEARNMAAFLAEVAA